MSRESSYHVDVDNVRVPRDLFNEEALGGRSANWSRARAANTVHAWKRLFRLDRPEAHEANSIVVAQGSGVGDAFLLEAGLARITWAASDGSEVTLCLCLPGRVLGLCALALQIPHPVSAKTITPCLIYRIRASQIMRLQGSSLEVANLILNGCARDLFTSYVAMVEQKTLSAEERFSRMVGTVLAASGVRLFVSGHKPNRPVISDRTFAEMLGVAPEHFSRLKKRMFPRSPSKTNPRVSH